ncbi:MAG: SH3 domain-containing protein [Leptolyngbyaceae cyanobacterium RU_5_1]|nr:SH3 domain-containing protein [Leptolyngbyaceae cyanobacterium RU_5_1]
MNNLNMNPKSFLLIAAGVGAIAITSGVTYAIVQSSPPASLAPSPVAQAPTVSPSSSPPATRVAPLAPSIPVDQPGQTKTTTSSPAAVSTSQVKSDLSRELQSCVITMAVVNDTEPPLNVRSAPTNDSDKIAELENGAFVSVATEQNGWFQITEPIQGWIAKSRTRNGCNRKVENVSFAAGETSAIIRDRFIGTGNHQYRFNARKGQILTITSRQGPLPRVIAPGDKPLVDGPDDQRTRWSGELQHNGDYTVELDSNFRGYEYSFQVEIK